MERVGIVGGGVIGLSIAEELTRRGIQAEIFEKGPAVGMEASGAAAGILSPQGEAKGPGPFLDLLLAGFHLIPAMVMHLESMTGVGLCYRAGGMLAVAMTDEDEGDLEAQFSWQSRAGLQVERLSPAEIRSVEPALDGPVRWGIWWPQTVQLDNRLVVEAYRRILVSRGVRIHLGTPVARFLLSGNRVSGVEAGGRVCEFDWVVNCAGSWSGFDGGLPVPFPMVPIRGQILEFRTEKPLIGRILRTSRAYLVQRSDNRLIAGTTVERAGFDAAVTEEGKRLIRSGAEELVSGIRELPLQSAWAGLRPGTPDLLPILGSTPIKHLLAATGHYRNGILLAPITARLTADLITRGSCSVDLTPFSAARFS